MLDTAVAGKLREKLQSCDNLPSLSAVALEVLNLIRQDNASLKELAEVISQDPALATKVLRTVNSSFYGLAKKIKTIHHATVVLGMSAVKSLALSLSLVKTIDGAKGAQFNFRQFWTDSLTRGVAAKKLAASVAPDLLDEAFVGSLLSHIGMLAINTIAANEYEKVLSALKFEGGTIAEWEMKILGFTHSDCGAELGNVWRLPDEFIMAIQHHDETGEFLYSDPRTVQLVNIVRGASLISRCFMEADKTVALKEATRFAEQTWGIDSEQLDLLLNDVKGDVETAADLFDVAIEDTCSYDQILQIANAEMAKLLMAANQPGGGQAQVDQIQLTELQRERAELEKRAERLEQLAYRDSLTGLYNMRALGEQLDNLFAQARVTNRALGII
ncbi:MAG: HDOD domain-containing protein, partial [Hyphomicrobiaceae bacterium]|nr:HDOD domain-containing protein [Hyphomicrobiaceae bacterium]